MRTTRSAVWLGVTALALGLCIRTGDVRAQAASDLEVSVSGNVLENGGSWITPTNAESNSLAPFTEQRDSYKLTNKGGADLTLNKIELTLADGLKAEEFSLQSMEGLKPKALDFKETTLKPKESFSFYVRFYPVESTWRTATVTVTYNGSQTFSWTVKGKGNKNLSFFSSGTAVMEKLFGGKDTDEMVTGMVADKAGNVYFSGQVTQVFDKFSTDLFLGRINADGSLAWAKIWNGEFMDRSPDSGQNAETGGTAGAMAIDDAGFIYLCAAVSPAKYNNNFASLVMKVNPEDGEPVWEKLWRPEWPSSLLGKHSTEVYGIDVTSDTVYMTGANQGCITLVALSREDGSVKKQTAIDPNPGYNDRGHCVKVAADGAVYVGGLGNDSGILLRYEDFLGEEPKLKWVKAVELGRGSNINAMDIDAEGNVYCSCDVRGATTTMSVIKVSSAGKLLWGKSCVGSDGDRNNTHVVKVVDGQVFVGGRMGFPSHDTDKGDAAVLNFSAADGSLTWGAFYHNGTGPDEICEHRIKGIAVAGDELLLVGQVYSGNMNGVRYWGYWYNNIGEIVDFGPKLMPSRVKAEQVMDLPGGDVIDAEDSRLYEDLVDYLDFQDAAAKHDGKSPDGDLMFWKIKLAK